MFDFDIKCNSHFSGGYGLKTVGLANRGEALVPTSMELLNPEQEGKALCLYKVWAFDPLRPDGPNTFDECAEGLGMCHPFGWLTDYRDLYMLGRHDAPMYRSRFETVLEDYKAMILALVRAMDRTVPAGTQWTFGWSPYDLFWRSTPMGTAPYVITARGPEGVH